MCDDNAATAQSRLNRADLTGYEYVCALRDGLMARSPMAETIGWRVEAVEVGQVRLTATPGAHLFNNRTLHGGALATMIDGAMSAAVNSTLSKGASAVTQDLRVTFLRPVEQHRIELSVSAKVISRSTRTALAEASVSDPQGRLCAHGTGSFRLR